MNEHKEVAERATEALPETLNALLVPLADRNLLVPNTLLAELIPQQMLEPCAGQPDWVLGATRWRDVRIPVVSFERAAGRAVPSLSRARWGVFSAQCGDLQPRYYAVVTQGIPRSVRVDMSLAPAAEAAENLEQIRVQFEDELPSCIPDLITLEQRLVEAGWR